MGDVVKSTLRAVTEALQIPTIIILLLLIAITIFLLGSILVEVFADRRHLKASIPKVIDDIQGMGAPQLQMYFKKCPLLNRQKKALGELITRDNLPDNSREALARQLLYNEQEHYDKRTKFSEVIAKIAPMFGLLGTLIPLGPGLIALGQGDTKTLSESLLIAFDTTVAGLISGAVAFVITAIRNRWYEKYMVGLETIMECILDVQDLRGKKNADQ
ncbi:MAG: MotA/TolQ/ExbB proton channel family protein [Firmicutes bacterium]|nr:MotA/TolQ/ExbB proton channel family protein [Bacillota bacterium]MBR2512041.1 MotA/TolQ/ExbB proton channel family protein [Bacillota bacterium]